MAAGTMEMVAPMSEQVRPDPALLLLYKPTAAMMIPLIATI